MRGSAVPGRQHIWSRLSKRLGGLLLAALLAQGAALAADGGPRSVVEGLHAALLESMRNADELGYAGRYEALEPVLRQSFDFPFMTRLSLGRAWNELEAPEQARLVELFAQMSIANFAARFDGFSGERFEIRGQSAGPRDAVVIESAILRSADDPVALNYVLRAGEGGWQMIDVLLDGKYSELARQRAEFAAVLASGGLPELVATLERKIEELAGQG
jgi:phospholipid transport system substrate-binding protein